MNIENSTKESFSNS